jgi:hypothetical protein
VNARERFERLEKATDLPLALLALLIVPALVLEERATSEVLRTVAHAINWIVWLAFCAVHLLVAVLFHRPVAATAQSSVNSEGELVLPTPLRTE